jgi:hypothetical protein
MNKLILVFTFLISAVCFLNAQSAILLLEGNYQGKNLFVQNPFGSGGVGFCVSEVLINGNVSTDEIQSSAFEIDLKSQKLNLGDKVEIKIKHKSDCKPKVLNPEVLKPKSTYELASINLSNDGTLTWTTKNESGKLPYVIEQFRWNKWLKVGEMEGAGTPSENSYTFKVSLHSGKNQVRVRQTDYTNLPHASRSAEIVPSNCELEFSPIKVSTIINFNCTTSKEAAATLYEIYDQYGNIVKKGYGDKIDASNLTKGGYYLNYDNKFGEFIKK